MYELDYWLMQSSGPSKDVSNCVILDKVVS